MYRPRLRRKVLSLGLLVTLLVLALGACGEGGQEEEAAVKARPLPKDPGALRPGEYHSVDFKASLSFRVGKGWLNTEPQSPDFIEVGQPGEGGWILFANVKEVYKPGTLKVVEAPKDLVGWFQHHPYLKTSKPQSVTVEGVKGKQFDVVVEVPEGYFDECGSDCMDISRLNGEETVGFEDGNKTRIIVLEDVKGETVALDIGVSEANDFDEFMPEAKKVLDTVKWGGS